ncbi:MAG: 3-oxoacyl-ACP reductase, partial [Proteobacteria bacterium]
MNSAQRRALVTGGSGDLGGAICRQLAAQGR